MSIIRRKLQHEYRFTQIPNEWLRDPRLSLKAKGLLSQLLSHAEGWKVTIKSLAKANNCGRDAVRGAVRELEDLGYLQREQSRATGGEFSEVIWATSEPLSVEPLPDNPVPVNPSYKNTNSKNTIEKNTISKKYIVNERWNEEFQTFWDTYPRKVGIANARKAFEKYAEKYLAEMLDGAVRIASDPNLPETTFIPHPSTWLNREGWNDEPYPVRSSGGKISNAQRNLLEYEETMRGELNGEARSSRAVSSD
tara:strand:- start:3990 stop:4742 length:753 start_codon:yes stop_codon:yes gene_type:complete